MVKVTNAMKLIGFKVTKVSEKGAEETVSIKTYDLALQQQAVWIAESQTIGGIKEIILSPMYERIEEED